MDRTLRLTGRIDFLSKTWIIVAPVGFNIHADVLVARCVSSKTRKSEGDDEGDFCAVADVADARCIWVAEPSIAKTERDAMMDVAPDKPAMWMFVNPNVRGPLGYPTGYEIMPGITAASLLDPEDKVQKVGAFSTHQLWVTPYKHSGRYSLSVAVGWTAVRRTRSGVRVDGKG